MRALLAVPAGALISVILVDGFEAMVLPRRVTHSYRLSRAYYRTAWSVWRGLGCRLSPGRRREAFLSVFGPLSLLGLFAAWVTALIFGFGVLHWSLQTTAAPGHGSADLVTCCYFSGETFFTLGYGDVTAATTPGRFLAVFEAGLGFGFMAVVIGYLPVLYQAFSRREGVISLLDARAGSPPTASELLVRLTHTRSLGAIGAIFVEWERWAAEVLESHLSFPVLSYYRSQHDNQSWLGALTAVLDSCALFLAAVKGGDRYQAQLTFAMARHAAVDLALVFRRPPLGPVGDRWPEASLEKLCLTLRSAGLEMRDEPGVRATLLELRAMYEPFVAALARHFLFSLPPVFPEKPAVDNWQTSAWMRRVPGIGRLPGAGDDHFD